MTNILRIPFVVASAFASVAFFASAPAMAAPSPAEKQQVVCALRANPELLAVLQKSSDYQGVACGQQTAAKPAASAPKPDHTKRAAVTEPANQPPGKVPAKSPPDPLGYLLRNDWSDVGLLGGSCFQAKGVPSAVGASDAKGASVSFTRDYANNNKIWQAQAVGGVTYTTCDLNLAPWPNAGYIGTFEKTIALYAQVNSDYNSNAALAKKNNQDIRTLGLSGEFGYLYDMDFNVIRVTPNIVFDNIKNTTNAAAELQYVPIWVDLPYVWHFYPLFDSFFLRFDPTFDLQYASAMEHSQPLQFSGKDQSLRIGPELTFIINSDAGGFWSNLVFSETFHPWYEAYNSRASSYWWDNSVTYNVTSNIGLKFSYDRGLSENSGTMTNQYIASLTGKI